MLVWLRVQVAAADRAEAGAVGSAEDLVRKREGDRVARPGGEVEPVVHEVRRPELLVAVRARRLVLAVLHADVQPRVGETADARADEAHVELELEQEARGHTSQRQRSLGRLRDRDVALAAELERLEVDLLDVPELLPGLLPDRADVERGHHVQRSEADPGL